MNKKQKKYKKDLKRWVKLMSREGILDYLINKKNGFKYTGEWKKSDRYEWDTFYRNGREWYSFDMWETNHDSYYETDKYPCENWVSRLTFTLDNEGDEDYILPSSIQDQLKWINKHGIKKFTELL